MGDKKRILFVAESVTLAHVARPFVLASSLDSKRYEVHFASNDTYDFVLKDSDFVRWPIFSISPERFMRALARGAPVYDTETLMRYVRDDLSLFEQIKPDLVVGDFRLSLAASARLANIPYITITNAYWSPYAKQRFPLPDLPMNRILGVPISRVLFNLVRPAAFAVHTLPLNRVLRSHGLRTLGFELTRVYTEADFTLYADLPELISTTELPKNHHYIGPVVWSPSNAIPCWWDEVPRERPIIYVSLGSSGPPWLLQVVLNALSDQPVTIFAACAGREAPHSIPENAFCADYLPGTEAASRAALVVCNGGSPTTMQALREGIPVVGIANNMDQYLNMSYLVQAGVGQLVRSGQANPALVQQAVRLVLDNTRYRERAGQVMHSIQASRTAQGFARVVGAVFRTT